MAHAQQPWKPLTTSVVGSFGSLADLSAAEKHALASQCDLIEIRLDILHHEQPTFTSESWSHLRGLPMLFTARRHEEGGAGTLTASERTKLLQLAREDAALIDIEVASINEMASLIGELNACHFPWVASFHDFEKLPDNTTLTQACTRAKAAGAAAFKAAAMLHSPADIARLADFQLADHGLPVSTMGMGPLAPVSRILCAQCGSVLNYGYIGEKPTAPGQWDAASLKAAIARSAPLTS